MEHVDLNLNEYYVRKYNFDLEDQSEELEPVKMKVKDDDKN